MPKKTKYANKAVPVPLPLVLIGDGTLKIYDKQLASKKANENKLQK